MDGWSYQRELGINTCLRDGFWLLAELVLHESAAGGIITCCPNNPYGVRISVCRLADIENLDCNFVYSDGVLHVDHVIAVEA